LRYLSQRFGEATRVMLGKINAIDLLSSHPFFGGWGTERFWHLAFVVPPSGVVPPVIMGGGHTSRGASCGARTLRCSPYRIRGFMEVPRTF
jgi:hypothetical protein